MPEVLRVNIVAILDGKVVALFMMIDDGTYIVTAQRYCPANWLAQASLVHKLLITDTCRELNKRVDCCGRVE